MTIIPCLTITVTARRLSASLASPHMSDDEKADEDSNEATDEEVVSVYAYLFHNVS